MRTYNTPWQPAPFKVGQRLRFIRKGFKMTFCRNGRDESDGTVTLKYGTEVVVTKINKGYHAHIADLGDGPEEIPPMHGWNTLAINGFDCRAVDVDSMGDWELVSQPSGDAA